MPAAAGSQMVYTLLEIAVMGETAEIFQLPLNLCLVLDHSLSMRGEKMDRVKEAARYVLSQLGQDDALSVVAFNDRATVMAPAGGRNWLRDWTPGWRSCSAVAA